MLITTQEKWPYADNSFDFITSNQVMEHVMDHEFVFREIARCLRPGGICINLFPIREVLWEGHAHMPLVHQIRNVKKRARFMYLLACLGFKRLYFQEMERRGWKSLEEFTRIFAQVIETDTNYITEKELKSVAERANLNLSFTYTKDFYIAKAKSFFENRPYIYNAKGFIEKIIFFFCKHISSITVLLKKAT